MSVSSCVTWKLVKCLLYLCIIMNTALSRLNSVFAYNLTTLAVLAGLVFLSTNFKDKTMEIEIAIPSPKV